MPVQPSSVGFRHRRHRRNGLLVCRYDKLVGMFSSKDVPAVGVSVGIERVFNLLEDKIMAVCKDESGAVCGKIRETDTEVTDLIFCLQHS